MPPREPEPKSNPADDSERLPRHDDDIRKDLELLEKLRAPFSGIPPEKIERDVSKIVAEARRELRERLPGQ